MSKNKVISHFEPGCLKQQLTIGRIIVFYPTAAMMALFLNILMDPLNPQVEADVALLASTADLIHSLPIQRLTSHEVAHVELVTEFVAELSALSKKAIAKATAECKHRREA